MKRDERASMNPGRSSKRRLSEGVGQACFVPPLGTISIFKSADMADDCSTKDSMVLMRAPSSPAANPFRSSAKDYDGVAADWVAEACVPTARPSAPRLGHVGRFGGARKTGPMRFWE